MSSWNYEKNAWSYKTFSNYVAWQALAQAKCASIFSEAVVQKFHRETPVFESLINKVARLKPCKFIKKRLQHMCFPVKNTNFLKTPFLQNTSGSCFYFLSCSYWSTKKGSLFVWKWYFLLCLVVILFVVNKDPDKVYSKQLRSYNSANRKKN